MDRILGPVTANDPGLLQLTRERYLVAPTVVHKITPHPNHNSTRSNSYETFPSWKLIHSILKDLFGRVNITKSVVREQQSENEFNVEEIQRDKNHQENMFFVEAGALDGLFFSNSAWLESTLGWKGLLVEADPVNFVKLKVSN